MNTKSFRFFVVFVLLIFIIGLAFLGISVSNTMNKTEIVLEDHFNNITDIMKNLQQKNAVHSSEFLLQLEELLNTDPYIAAVTLQDGNTPFFAWPVNSNSITINSNGIPEINSSTPFLKCYNAALSTDGNQTVIVTAALHTILQSEFYRLCTIAFIIILSGTVFDLLVLLYVKIFSDKNSEDDSDETEENEEEKDTETATDEISSDFHESETLDELESEINEIASSKQTETTESTVQSVSAGEQARPAGLFSEITGLGWESYLESRLDAELERAASNEMDLSLFVINIPGLERNSDTSLEICEKLLQFFKYPDMTFEYGDSGFAGIMVNMIIDDAMMLSEQIFIEIKKVLENHGDRNELGIGISTRSLRLISGERLIKEASEASVKALQETTLPIVAFRVNPEKYREYLAKEAEKNCIRN